MTYLEELNIFNLFVIFYIMTNDEELKRAKNDPEVISRTFNTFLLTAAFS